MDEDNQRYIQHELRWEPTALISYTAETTFQATLTLNNSDDSKFGPGTYLDYDTTDFEGTLPERYFSKEAPWHATWRKVFTGGSTAPDLIQSNQTYIIRFLSSKPGQANQDNAELTITFDKSTCWLFCSSGAYCHIHDGLFSLEPIPGSIDWQPDSDRCAEWQPIWIPWVSR